MFFVCKRRFFTLLEILVALTILALGAALTSLKINDFYQQERSAAQVRQFMNDMAMAQELMLILDADVQMYLEIDPHTKQLCYWMDVEKPLGVEFNRLVHTIENKQQCSGIDTIAWDGNSKERLKLDFIIGKMTQGLLTLNQGEKKIDITLIGYPSPIIKGERSISLIEKIKHSQLLYPAAVYEELYEKNGIIDIQKPI